MTKDDKLNILVSKLINKKTKSTSQKAKIIAEKCEQEVLPLEDEFPPLPTMRDDYGSMPVVMAVAKLFHSHRVNRTVTINNKLIGNYKGKNLHYIHGERLTYQDEELLMALFLIYSRTHTPFKKNEHVKIRISDLRDFLGLSKGGKNDEKIYSRLETMKASTFALSSIDFDPAQAQGERQTFNFLSFLRYERGEIEYALDPIWSQIFSEFPITQINIETRMQLSPHARVIHRLLSTSSNTKQSLPESRLLMFIGWEGPRIHDFWYAMRDASQELKDLGIVRSFTIFKSSTGERVISYVVDQRKLKPNMGLPKPSKK